MSAAALAALIARYLANKPEGPPEWYLVASVVVCTLAAMLAGWQRNAWRVLMALGLGSFALALLTH